MESNSKENLSAPWYIHHEKLKAMFADDKEITVGDIEAVSNAERVIMLKVSNPVKAFALNATLQKRVEYGNIVLTIIVDDIAPDDRRSWYLYSAAFDGNRNVVNIDTNTNEAGTMITYPIMNTDPIQFSADNDEDYYGNVTMLPAGVAKDIFMQSAFVKFSSALIIN